MANRINGNIIIVDSAMGNSLMLLPPKNLSDYRVGAISFFAISTLANIILTNANTSTDVVFNCNYITIGILSANNGFVVNNPQQVTFPGGLRVSDLKVPTLTAGTAYLYLV